MNEEFLFYPAYGDVHGVDIQREFNSSEIGAEESKKLSWWEEDSLVEYPYLLVSFGSAVLSGTETNIRERLQAGDVSVLGDSVVGDTQLMIKEKGEIKSTTFEELGERYFDEGEEGVKEINKDLKVLDIDSQKEVSFSKPTWIKRNKYQEPIVEINTIGGRNIEVTDDHSVMIVDENYDFVSKKAKDVEEGNFLIGVRDYPRDEEETIDKKFAEFLGLWIADGSLSHYEISFSCPDEETRNVIEEIAERHGSSVKYYKNGVDLTFNSKEVAKLLERLCGDVTSYTKSVPNLIFSQTDKVRGAFLRGYFSGDGSVTDSDEAEIGWATVSKRLFFDIALLLGSLGINSNLTIEKEREFDDFGKKYTARRCYDGAIYSFKDKKKFNEKVGFLQNRKNEILNKCIQNPPWRNQGRIDGIPYFSILEYMPPKGSKTVGRHLVNDEEILNSKRILNDNLLYLRVKSVKEREFDGFVYDFKIPETNTFIANNTLVHNSGGYQLETGVINSGGISPTDVLNWQEENSDFGPILDVPVKEKEENLEQKVFKRKLKETKEHVEEVADQIPSRDVKIYGMVHGFGEDQLNSWWEECVEPYRDVFAGVGFSGTESLPVLAERITFLDSKGVEVTHSFGPSSFAKTMFLGFCLNHLGFKRLSYDNSNWSRLKSFGQIYTPEFRKTEMGKKGAMGDYDHSLKFCTCPACELAQRANLTWDNLNFQSGPLMNLHNIYTQRQMHQFAHWLSRNKTPFARVVKRRKFRGMDKAIEIVEKHTDKNYHEWFGEKGHNQKTLDF